MQKTQNGASASSLEGLSEVQIYSALQKLWVESSEIAYTLQPGWHTRYRNNLREQISLLNQLQKLQTNVDA